MYNKRRMYIKKNINEIENHQRKINIGDEKIRRISNQTLQNRKNNEF